MTTHLSSWEDRGWIDIRNTHALKKAAYALKVRTATTSFKWVKGHEGNQGNEESDRLAKTGAEKNEPDTLDWEIPKEFDLQGAKLSALTQAIAYKGIIGKKPTKPRRTTTANLQHVKQAISDYNEQMETDETIWKNIQNQAFRPKVQQFLYKSMHATQKIGNFWTHIPGYEDRKDCTTCGTTESMEHILTQCTASPVRTIWNLARQHWPHAEIPWPEINIGTILGCGSLTLPANHPPGENRRRQRSRTTGKLRLLQILISESAHLVWALRCERVIQEKTHTNNEISNRWHRAINKRLTDDKIIATKIKRDKSTMKWVIDTWEEILKIEGQLPTQWVYDSEVLVGRRKRGQPINEP